MKNKLNMVIIGAGPAGLTAALELIRRNNDDRITVIEALDDVGGLARTIVHNGNRMDIGGHRFFSKSNWVMDWWRKILPVSKHMELFEPVNDPSQDLAEADRLAQLAPDRSMLVRPRLSRIYYLRKFFDYPISLSQNTIRDLGMARMLRIGLSYLVTKLRPIKPEHNLEDFLINRFGRRLYHTFFKEYTEKVWGVKCQTISSEWGAQRIKGLSITKAVAHAFKKTFNRLRPGVAQQDVETSLIEKFLYPKYGPGQMWQAVEQQVVEDGGTIIKSAKVTSFHLNDNQIARVVYTDSNGQLHEMNADFVISSMPIKDLINSLLPEPPKDIVRIANGLCYRDFITIGMLVKKLKPTNLVRSGYTNNLVPDTWIYIQEPGVKIGRLQIFNNWSPGLVIDHNYIWLGLEYFCTEGDELWEMSDSQLTELARRELCQIDLINASDVLDMTVIKVEKAYPAYFGSYCEFPTLRTYLDKINNLLLIGRNGMHRYNNQDHSMLTAKLAVEAIISGHIDRNKIWDINVEQEYHEEKS